MNALTTDEAADRAKHERTISQGMQSFVDVGIALREIRDRRLFRDTHPTFEEYLEGKWEMSLPRAKQFIVAAEVETEVSPPPAKNCETATNVAKTPVAASKTTIPSEGVARAVAESAPKGKRKEVWDKAVKTAPKDEKGKPQVTAAHVRRVARDEPARTPAPAEPDTLYQSSVKEVESVLEQIDALLRQLSRLLDAHNGEKKCHAAFAYFIPYTGTIGSIKAALATTRENLPGAIAKEPPGYVSRRSVELRKGR